MAIRQQQVEVSPEDSLSAEKQSNTSNLNMLNTCISLIKCVHCTLSICGFFRNVLLRHISQFRYSFPFPCSAFMLFWRTCVPKSLNSCMLSWSIEKSKRRTGLRLVYYKEGFRRLSANKRKLVWKVLRTRLTLFVFFLGLGFGLYVLKVNLVRHILEKSL